MTILWKITAVLWEYRLIPALLFAVMSLVTFLLFGIDKYKAKHGLWRIPEKTLFLCSFLCGSVGAALGMEVFHHKTLHTSFRILIPLSLLLHLLFWGFLLYAHLFIL